MKRSAWVVGLAFLALAGCATSPVSVVHSRTVVQVELSARDGERYALRDEERQLVAAARAADGRLLFRVPDGWDADQCFRVVGPGRETLVEDFRAPLIDAYQRRVDERRVVASSLARFQRMRASHRETVAEATRVLAANRAFRGGWCSTPARRPLPPAPEAVCDSARECRQEGAAICYSLAFGSEGCAIALRESNLDVPGVLAAPGCAAMVANLAGRKYGMDAAVVDLMHGLVDDVADSMIEGDSIVGALLGVGIKTANYAVKIEKAKQCANAFVRRYYGARQRWERQVREIRAEPARLQRTCVAVLDDLREARQKLAGIEPGVGRLRAQLAEADAALARVRSGWAPVAPCGPRG